MNVFNADNYSTFSNLSTLKNLKKKFLLSEYLIINYNNLILQKQLVHKYFNS